MHVSYKIMLNRPKIRTRTIDLWKILREQSQCDACSGVWKKVQVRVSNEGIRDVQINVIFACFNSSYVQISSRFES